MTYQPKADISAGKAKKDKTFK